MAPLNEVLVNSVVPRSSFAFSKIDILIQISISMALMLIKCKLQKTLFFAVFTGCLELDLFLCDFDIFREYISKTCSFVAV